MEYISLLLVPITTVVTWIFARRKQKNDFLDELQKSIDMLITKNAELTDMVVKLRSENTQLKAVIDDLSAKLEHVTRITVNKQKHE